ncbi:MAG: 3-deoxy-D-manno-octulosonic acid transferase [Alloprevotella sp.]|nr:3-deoxy-D-manno-octulosonic acid transferase [Alloprevotella sp.]
MYSLAIYIYMLGVNIAALFGNEKARLMRRGHRQTWKTLRESIAPGDAPVWFHAASLGEFEQGRPLMERLRREQPEQKILLTFFSPSGYEVRKDYEGADVVCYLPFDTMPGARKFLRLAHPSKAFFIKYEFWANYLFLLHRRGTPVYSVSSIFRPGQIFFRWWNCGYSVVLRWVTHYFVQNEESRQLLANQGLENATVVGDTRFDRVVDIMRAAKPLPIAEAFARERTVIVAGSTWREDEDLLLDYFNRHPDVRLLLAPHVVSEGHLQEITGKLKRTAVRYTKTTPEEAALADCLIIDCYRLLSSLYRYATVCYVGGGFGAGIHNVPEAAVYARPVLIGPNNGKFQEAQALLENGGCREVRDQASLDAALDGLLADSDALRRAGEAAGGYIHRNAGATETIFRAVFPQVSEVG